MNSNSWKKKKKFVPYVPDSRFFFFFFECKVRIDHLVNGQLKKCQKSNFYSNPIHFQQRLLPELRIFNAKFNHSFVISVLKNTDKSNFVESEGGDLRISAYCAPSNILPRRAFVFSEFDLSDYKSILLLHVFHYNIHRQRASKNPICSNNR